MEGEVPEILSTQLLALTLESRLGQHSISPYSGGQPRQRRPVALSSLYNVYMYSVAVTDHQNKELKKRVVLLKVITESYMSKSKYALP